MAPQGKRLNAAIGGRKGWPVHLYLLALAILVALGGFICASYVRASAIRETEGAVGQAASFTAELAAREIHKDLDELASTATGLASTNLGDVLVNPESCSLTFSGLGAFPKGHLDILGPDGTVLCSSNPGSVSRSVNYGSENWFKDADRTNVLVGPVIDASSGAPAVVRAFPSESGVVVAGFLDLRALGSGLSVQFGGARQFEFVVVSADGRRIVSRSIDASRWSGTELTDNWPTEPETFERADLDGNQRYYGGADVPEIGWTVFAGVGRDATLAPAQRLYRQTTFIILLGTLLTFAALWVVWTRIARPIRALGQAVRSAATDPTQESVSVRGPAEVTSLGAGFDALLDSYADRERALRESEERYRDMFERAVEGIAITTLDGKILEANPAMATILGYDSPAALMEAVSVARDIYMNPEDRDRIMNALAAKEPVELDLTLRHADGGAVIASMNYIPILNENREIESIHTRVIDQTQRRQLERQLAQSQRLESLGQLAGGIAHDFNNLLAVIMNYSTFVQEALQTSDQTESLKVACRDVEQISNAATRAASLTHRLLTFARQEVVRLEVVSPNSIIEEVEKLLSRTIGEDIEFTFTLAADLWSVRIDPGQLQQVIVNLAVNARDAMPDGGVLAVETSNLNVDEGYAATQADLEAGRYVRIRVSDSGTGMSPEIVDQIFDPFFTTKPAGQGTGLGLATVHGIVAQAGGSIHVYTEPGVGTSMSVLFPVTDKTVSVERKEQVRILTGDETVLVVEDEDAIREVVRRILTRHGYEAILAPTGAEAIAVAEDRSRRIDLVVTDVVMPGMLGREVTERISELRPGTRFIYMSGYAAAVLDSRGRLEPGRALVEKPFSQAELLTVVREALDRQES